MKLETLAKVIGGALSLYSPKLKDVKSEHLEKAAGAFVGTLYKEAGIDLTEGETSPFTKGFVSSYFNPLTYVLIAIISLLLILLYVRRR